MFNKKMTAIVCLILTMFSLSGCNKQESYDVGNDKKVILRLAETQSLNYPSTKADLEFARLVEEKSKGRIKVKVYDSGKLGDETSVVEQLQFGGIDMARVSLSSLTQYSTATRVTMLPYVVKSRDHMWKLFDGIVGKEIQDQLFKEKNTLFSLVTGEPEDFIIQRSLFIR